MLRAEHITKQYSLPDSGHTVFDAVSDVSLELKDGCVSSLVGESGSGKSTLARVLSYIELPDIGKVFLGDLEVTSCKRKEIRSVRGKVQLVMQNALGSLDPHQSVAAILEEPLQLLFHMKAQDRRCRCLELMDMVRLERSTPVSYTHLLPVCIGLENGTGIPDYDTHRNALLHGPDEGIP